MPTAPLIGRASQLADIVGAWPATKPRVVLITGEAGSGKSRLVAEVLGRLDLDAAVVLAGAARTLGAAPHDWLASVLSGRSTEGLPVDEPVLAQLAQRSPDQRSQEQDGGEARLAPAAMLRAAVGVVRALLGGRSGVLVVEDLHDLDPASLTLVGELAATSALPALLLVTSRPPQEAAFAPAAARILRKLGGAPSVIRAHLTPFTARETAELIEAHYGSTPAPETVRAVLRRTGGNPFWLTELLSTHSTADELAAAPLPAHLTGLLVEPLAGEPALVGRVARAAALLGDPVESDVLVHVCGGDVEPALRRLLDLGMLIIAPDLAPAGPLRFRHPLLREALARTALPRERAQVHERARALAAELGDDAALARQSAALGRIPEARAAAVRGAAASLAAGLPEAAVDLVDLALRLPEPAAPAASSRPAPQPASSRPADHRALTSVGAEAAFVAARFALAADHAADWLQAAEEAREHAERPGDRAGDPAGDRAGDPADGSVDGLVDEVADAHRRLAAVRWCLGDAAGHRRSLDRAAAVGGSPASIARQRAAEAESALRAEDAASALPLAEVALAAAERAGTSIAGASVTLGTALAFTGAFERGTALLRAARQLAERERDPVTIGRAVHNLVAVSLPRLGDVSGWRLFDEAMAALARFGLEFCAGRTTSLGIAHAVRIGDLARAESLVWSRLPIEGDPVERVRFAARAGLLAVERGDDPLAVRMLARADAEGRDAGLVRVLRVAVAARGVHPVDPVRALTECVGRCSPERLVEAARWALHGGVPADVAAAIVQEQVAEQPPQLRLLLAVAAGRDAEAAALLPEALGSRTAAPNDAAVHTAVAHALLRSGQAGEARQHAERAVALLAHWPGWRLTEAETLLHSLRAGGDLTAREIEVLGCLAAGMSNQQVASSLGISIRTVTVHVSNLLRKTGAASRTEAALWAVRHRLAPER